MDERVVPTRAEEAAATLRETANHFRALGQLGVDAQPPSDLITAAWEFLGAVSNFAPAESNTDHGRRLDAVLRSSRRPVEVEVKHSDGNKDGKALLPRTRQSFDNGHYVTYLVTEEGAVSRDAATFKVAAPAGDSSAHTTRALRRSIEKYLRSTAGERAGQSTTTPTVRDTVIEVIEQGEEVDVATVHDRVVGRGINTSSAVISNELSRWTRVSVLKRVRRGIYARPEDLVLPDPQPAADPSSDVQQEGDADASQSAGAATV